MPYPYPPFTPKVDCTVSNSDVYFEQNGPSTTTILLTYGICICAIAMEVIVHSNINPKIDFLFLNRNGKLDPTPPAYNASGTDEDETAPQSENVRSCSPTKYVRVYRFVLATFLMVPLVVCFGIRMSRLHLLRMFPDCTYRDRYYAEPIWFGIVMLNIVPLMIGCTAWLRSAADYALFSKGITVPYPKNWYPLEKGRIGWPPCLPFYIVYLAIAFPISWTGWIKCEERGKDKEQGEEERERLVGSGAVDDVEFEAPPPYEEICRV